MHRRGTENAGGMTGSLGALCIFGVNETMCGICGIVLSKPFEATGLERVVHKMICSLKHRGPDGQGIQTFMPPVVPYPLALGHTRLAILDLSDAGRQPMSNEDETVWVVFNGEIYNFQQLRRELVAKGHRFRSHTDTEVLVHLYEEEGAEFVKRLNGMFAFAILDLPNKRLLLARDPIGIKPLYYWHSPQGFFFASEIKALLASPFYSLDVNWQAVYDYFTYLYVPCPETIFAGIKQLPPAHFLLLDLESNAVSVERYWRVRRIGEWAQASVSDLKAMVRELLADSVQRQMVSDVPLGIFLSGGVDSTIVTGLAKQFDPSVQTFTVVFEGEEFAFYNEQEVARAVSHHLQTDHHELRVPDVNPIEVLDLIEFFDQPFGNPTFYLMHLISKQAREHITVALCGAGGDELYAGYPRYQAVQLAKRLRFLPRLLLRLGQRCLGLVRDSYRTMHLRRARQFLEGLDDDFVRQFARWTYHMDEEQKAKLLGEWTNPGAFLPSERILRTALTESCLEDEGNRLLHLDVKTFLLNNLLEYTDKMSMAVALEVRVPLLDHRFVELSLNVPFAYKLRNGQSKVLLREAFKDFFPIEARKAPKRGFNVPLPHWMQHTFNAYFEASQSPTHPLRRMLGSDIGVTWREGILNWDFIQQLRWQHFQGRRDNSYELFAIIVFDVWWRKYVQGGTLRLAEELRCAS